MGDKTKVTIEKEFKLKDDFIPPTFEEWKKTVEKDLKGASFEKKLLTETYEGITLFQKNILCVQCNACVAVCPENALALKPGLVLSELFFVTQELTRAEPIQCLECGKPFGTKKSYERIVKVNNYPGRCAKVWIL